MKHWQVALRLDGVDQVLELEADTGEDALATLREDYAAGLANRTRRVTYRKAGGGELVLRWGGLSMIEFGAVTPAPDQV